MLKVDKYSNFKLSKISGLEKQKLCNSDFLCPSYILHDNALLCHSFAGVGLREILLYASTGQLKYCFCSPP